VPEAEILARSKGAIALAEVDRLRAAGVRFGLVLADAGYGASAAFRHGLDARGLRWAVGIPRTQKVYDRDVRLIPPAGRKRRPAPDQEPQTAEAALAGQRWRRVSWRGGTKGPLSVRFAALRVRVGDGATFANNRHLPGEEVWLLGEWRANGERKYYLSNLLLSQQPAAADLAARSGARGQGPLGLRASASAAETGARSRPFRGALLDRAASTRVDDLHRLCLSPAPAPRRASFDGAGEKCPPAFRDRHQHPACRRCAAPLSGGCSCLSSPPSDVRIAANSSSRRLITKCPCSARACRQFVQPERGLLRMM